MSQQTTNRYFDELASGLASGTLSRGKALKLMGAALVGGTLASLGIGGEAAAAPEGCKRDGKKCKRNTQCCSSNCVNGVCGGACGFCPEPCFCETNLLTGDQACVQPNGRIEADCNACRLRGEVCVAGDPGEVTCLAFCPITPPSCGFCPEPCACETEFFSRDPVCVQPIIRIEADCNECLDAEVCVGGGTPGQVGCARPCP